ncbi:MAG TPA: TonB-dependent receptor [Edaphocola sp.]|nr:TonB-dependent receptor [Edaphocola sp.]
MLRKPILLFCLALLCAAHIALAQKKYTVSGYVREAGSGESLTGAAVYITGGQAGVTSNAYGFYSLSLPAGQYQLTISFTGYESQTVTLNLISNQAKDFSLSRDRQQLKEITISARAADQNVKSTQMGAVTLDVAKIKKLPVLFGETDVMKTLQLLPGVQAAGEGNAGFYIRGGGPDQNLVLLDNTTIYNTGHMFGFFSVFNGDAIKNVTLIKGVAPANYGGRLSSVVDVEMKDGNKEQFKGSGGIGLISSRLTLEGPMLKHKSSFMLSGRRTYIDVLSKPFIKGKMKGTGYYFYDLNLKADLIAGKKDHIFLSGYFGKDVFTFHSKGGTFNVHIPWGNATASMRWNHQFGPKLFLNTTAIFNDYRFAFNGEQNDFNIGFRSAIRDWTGKVGFDYYPGPRHHIQFGGNFTNHKFVPNQASGSSDSMAFSPDNALIKHADEAGLYALDEWKLSDRLEINAGLRYSWFGQTGPYTAFQTDQDGNKMDSTVFPPGKIVQAYHGLEPRFSLRYDLGDNSSLKAGLGKTFQYLSLVSNNGSTLPTDIWVPSTALVQPQVAWQYSVGYFRNFLDNALETSVEVYYRSLENQIEYRAGYTPTSFRDPELDFVFGKGHAYGAEFFVHKTKGKFTGWIGYTLAWSWRQFPDLNNGERFPAKYDRRHDLSVVASYQINPKLTASAVFVYASGNAITLPTGYYFIENNLVEDFSKINGYRIFPYHRLDLSLVYVPHPERKGSWQGSWAFSIYNVYNRKNPYLLFVDTKGTLATGADVMVKQISIFPIIPSITYNFKF